MFVTMCQVCRRLRQMLCQHYIYRIDYLKFTKPLGEAVFIAVLPAQRPWVYVIFLFIINKYLDWMLTRIRVDLSFLRSEFARNLVGIYSEFTQTRILPIPSRSEWNGQNLVGMEIKFGWDFTQIPFRPNSYHSDQIPLRSTQNAWLRVKYSKARVFGGEHQQAGPVWWWWWGGGWWGGGWGWAGCTVGPMGPVFHPFNMWK